MPNHTLILPLEDPTKHGATEHVRAIRRELATQESPTLSLHPPLTYSAGSSGETSEASLLAACQKIKADAPNSRFQILSSDYGAEPTQSGPSILAKMKKILGEKQTTVFVSTHSLENKSVEAAFEGGVIDRLALPALALTPEALGDEAYAKIVRPNEDRFIRMVCVPHATDEALVREKAAAWRALAASGKVPALGPFPSTQRLIMAVLPGDVDNGLAEPLYYTPRDAEALARQIVRLFVPRKTRFPSGTSLLFTNSPRVFKYNKEAIAADRSAFRPNDKRFQNPDRMKGRASNPVSEAFYKTIALWLKPENIIDMTIQQGVLPSQAFLAGYDALNAHAERDGESVFVGNGESVTMCAEAITVLAPNVTAFQAETPAMLQTHKVGFEWLCSGAGLFHSVNLEIGKITPRNEAMTSHFPRPLQDAKTVATAMVEAANSPNMPQPHQAMSQLNPFPVG